MAQRLSQAPSWLYLAIALVVIGADQFLKNLAIASLEPGVSYPALGDILSWRLVYNDAAAFSIGFGYTWILAVISSIATLVGIAFGLKIKSISWSIMLGIFLGGVVGNLIDRLIQDPGFGNGPVVDYIQIPLNFPVFNLADIAIVTMASLAVLRVFLGENLGGLPAKKS